MFRTILWWGFVIFVFYFFITDPSGFAAVIHDIFHLGAQAGNSGKVAVNGVVPQG